MVRTLRGTFERALSKLRSEIRISPLIPISLRALIIRSRTLRITWHLSVQSVSAFKLSGRPSIPGRECKQKISQRNAANVLSVVLKKTTDRTLNLHRKCSINLHYHDISEYLNFLIKLVFWRMTKWEMKLKFPFKLKVVSNVWFQLKVWYDQNVTSVV